jgi:V/A-type H+-transporting ATPase subunit I
MKRIQMTVLKSDMDVVLEYLGHSRSIHFDGPESDLESASCTYIRELLEGLQGCAEYLGLELPAEPEDDSAMPSDEEKALAQKLCEAVNALKEKEATAKHELQNAEEAYDEAKAFSSLNIPFADMDQLSYLALRVGRLDPKFHPELKERLGDRAVVIPLEGSEDRVLVASSRKGRFALDSELKRDAFEPITLPEGFRGMPAELLDGLGKQHKKVEKDLAVIGEEKIQMRDANRAILWQLGSVLLLAYAVEQLKSKLISTSSLYLLSGWAPADMVPRLAKDLGRITEGRTAIRTYIPDEVPGVREGDEKVPVSLKHGAFVQGFEGVVFSYGAPLYGTIDPTPLVAFFFTLLFGIMFGDVGQGFVLLLAGLLTSKRGIKGLAKFKGYSSPLIAVGISSMIMGLLAGSVFTNEHLLEGPTRAITQAITGTAHNRILVIMPMAETGGSVQKLFYFFGFTVAIGIILNSIGLLINVVNNFVLRRYEKVFFAKTGLAGILLFWYAIFIAVRIIFGGRFESFDLAGILIPAAFIFFGPAIWRLISRQKPVLEHGLMPFIMEGFVEIIETTSTYISNTVSFLRVGAFALSHAVLSFIVFQFTDQLAHSPSPASSFSAILILVFGNVVIIVLEGMIVAIQVVRLQYYEFFGKFFSETGVEFKPFRFRKTEAE